MDMAGNVLGLLMIFFARIVDVSCGIVRILFLVKGQRFYAACLGFFEVMIYMLVLGHLLGGGKALSFVQIVFYCGGFATGNYLGAWIEERLLNTFVLVEIILDDNESARASIDRMRGMGLGATVINGEGRNGPKLVVEIFCHRHDVKTVQKLYEHEGFVTISDVKRCTGGWFPRRL
ncbi:UPF0316 protein [Synergistales bacterium]|nr:UPF0316 protein [Synergistales bacterium]